VLLREGCSSDGVEVWAGGTHRTAGAGRSARPELAVIIPDAAGHANEAAAARVIRTELPARPSSFFRARQVDEAMECWPAESNGYLLKSRITDVPEFIETVRRIAAGARWSPVAGSELIGLTRHDRWTSVTAGAGGAAWMARVRPPRDRR